MTINNFMYAEAGSGWRLGTGADYDSGYPLFE